MTRVILDEIGPIVFDEDEEIDFSEDVIEASEALKKEKQKTDVIVVTGDDVIGGRLKI